MGVIVSTLSNLLTNKNILNNKAEFRKSNYSLALSRIRVISFGIVLIGFYYFYADFILLKAIPNKVFIFMFSTHLFGFVSSSLYLIFYKYIKRMNANFVQFFIRLYIIIFLFIGSISSINSQRLTGNIDAYIIMILITSVIFHFEPLFMFFSFILNHIFFITGLTFFINNNNELITKQINSTAMAVAAILFCYSLYRHRVIDFINKYKTTESEANFKKLFNINPLPLFISSFNNGKVLLANDKALEFYNYSKEEFNNIFVSNLYKSDRDALNVLRKLSRSHKIQGYIVEQRSKLGLNKWVVANYELIEYSGEECILTSVTDITELKRMEGKLLNHASKDSLTGIFNRRTGIEILKHKISIGTPLILCFIDIDGLKIVNDTYGHVEGDNLINIISMVIKDSIKGSDIFFRYGGDEFIILFSNKSEIDIKNIWTSIKYKFDKLNSSPNRKYKISASHGLFKIDKNTNLTIEEILALADQKMYLEKSKQKTLG